MPGNGGRRAGAGRPKGSRTKATAEIKKYAQKFTKPAMAELARLALGAESEQARVAAIRELFDRGYGKAAQAITGEGGEGPVLFEVASGISRQTD